MSLTTTPGWWGISTWVQPYIGAVAAHAGLSAPRWASFAGMAYNVGAITGYIGLGFLADAFGRKRVPFAFFGMALLMTPVLFLWTHDISTLLLASAVTGFFSLGQYTWMPTWLPELYPTRIRGTAIAFCFNVPRLLAWSGRRDVFARSQDIFGVSGYYRATSQPELHGLLTQVNLSTDLQSARMRTAELGVDYHVTVANTVNLGGFVSWLAHARYAELGIGDTYVLSKQTVVYAQVTCEHADGEGKAAMPLLAPSDGPNRTAFRVGVHHYF